MQLTPLQLFCQEQILKKLYPDLNFEEAKDREYDYNGGLEIKNGYKPSLPRVLTALGVGWRIITRDNNLGFLHNPTGEGFTRNLLNEDKTDATLFDQSEATILRIAKFLGYNEL